MRHSPTIDRIACAVALIVVSYLLAYGIIRITHTKQWFDKSTEEIGNYTFFNTNSQSDTLLYRLFYPLLKLDSEVFNRTFEKDNW